MLTANLTAPLIAITILLGTLAPAPAQDAHPAVVRIIAQQRGGASYGSGALVAVTEAHGLVVTNWHVVRDATGPVTVVFPDSFRSAATVMKTDRDWDLAALAIHRPNTQPIALATEAPRPGDVLTIAGYGKGWYRSAAGRCTQYVSPGRNMPFEMVELSTTARNGDSGGPILNSRGELAGVLFGAGFGRTTGSYCGRVRWFLDEPVAVLHSLPSPPTMIADRRRSQPRVESAKITGVTLAQASAPPANDADNSIESNKWLEATESYSAVREFAELPVPRPRKAPVAEVSAASAPPSHARTQSTIPGRAEQIKTILAAIGVFALLFHALRLLGTATG